MTELSKNLISSYVSDVIPLTLDGEGIGKDSPIVWRTEGDVAAIRKFSGEGKCAFNHGVLVTLVKEGEGKIIAEYNGCEYSADVRARAMCCASSEDEFNFYVGDMHCHTTDIHVMDEFAKHERDDITDLVD